MPCYQTFFLLIRLHLTDSGPTYHFMNYQFPKDFIWGSATAAIQIEGAASEAGKGPSMWDDYCQQHPERIFQQANPAIACDHYHRMPEDVALIQQMAHNGYRFSLSWPRLLPQGTGALNSKGVAFYDRLIDRLLAAGIAPNVTLYHWDLPLALAQQGGWGNRQTVDHFVAYAEHCFRLYGDRVPHWATINEPAWSILNGYVTALHPPCVHSYKQAIQAAHHMICAHALTIQKYHQGDHNGQIGIVLNMSTIYPATQSSQDRAAAQLADGALNRWFIDPVLLGRYPEDIWQYYADWDLLPEHSGEELGWFTEDSIDFIGVNYYYPHYASGDATTTQFHLNTTGENDPQQDCVFSIKGAFKFVKNPQGRYTDWDWEIYPEGLLQLLQRAESYRPGIPVYVTENGIGLQDQLDLSPSLPVQQHVDDQERIDFVAEHLKVIHQALAEGVNVKGYYMWSLMDNFSWINGYKKRYGFLYIDRDNNLQRYRKKSSYWYQDVIENNGF
ncbi:glycoside hydrolase family 1 protein [Corallincola spongiicola]|uniref:beta-glucosidase n=2 Tax=Corallincola spongiicola TaxID=2520508 RepID=A0ABY1WNY4_9GAMM|nr:glycoside hydrolase family 1 protein [Corallincola spongiicola]